MEDKEMLNILEKIKICLKNNSLDIAIDLITLEIEALNGITEKRCKNTIFNYCNWYCKNCYNLNCKCNKKL